MQYAADYQKFTVRVENKQYQFSSLDDTREANNALGHLLKLKLREMESLREELGGKATKNK